MLAREQIPNIKEWEETLSRLALKIAREMTFTALPHRQGEDMDIRRYVKIKKIPGGAPQDSEYVDGAVITKNVAHKQMSRSQKHPRIMLVTFPLEFHRVEGQYMPFGQIVRQEKEYLNNLVARIAALRPHVVLVERSVSRLALDALAKHNIAVARSVKMSAITTIARMTQGDVFSSMDKLALEPRMGHCGRYRLQTFDHPLIPNRRKTYMRFEGCSPDMGCTIILRGADIATLRRLKKITRFVTFMVRNLKLETHLWKDCLITLPPFNPAAVPSSFTLTERQDERIAPPLSAQTLGDNTVLDRSPQSCLDDLTDEEAEQRNLSRRIEESLEPYFKTFISVSATLRFPPPYPLRMMRELDIRLKEARRAWEDEIIRREEYIQFSHSKESTSTEVDKSNTLLRSSRSIDIIASPRAPPTIPGIEPFLSGKEESGSHVSDASASAASNYSTHLTPFSSGTSSVMGEVIETLRTEEDIRLESRLSYLKWRHEEQRRVWEWYLRKNKDDFIVETYQRISLWEYTVPIACFAECRACFAPRLNYITFYGENDCTLGQYIEHAIIGTLAQMQDAKALCAGKNCDQPLARHCKVYVHNETRLAIAVEPLDRSSHLPPPDLIMTWSTCKICCITTPHIPLSEEMQRYSFAKFLELHFYPADVKLVQGAGCEHNIYQHHTRYFALQGMAVRFQSDPITMYEIVCPPFRIRIRPETQLQLKNADYQKLHRRNINWYSGLIDDLKLISIEGATGDEKHDTSLLLAVNPLMARAEAERDEIARLINRVYKESAPTDTVALNRVLSYRQEKIVAWQQDFDRLPDLDRLPNFHRLPKSRNHHLTEKAFKRASAFAIWPRRPDTSSVSGDQHLPSASVSEVVSEVEEGSIETESVIDEKRSSFASESSKGLDAEISNDEHVEGNEAMTSELSTQAVTEDEPQNSGLETDSTIGAPRDYIPSVTEAVQVCLMEPFPGYLLTTQQEESLNSIVEEVPHVSRLPRRPVNQPTVAELVKKYQGFLPAQGVQDLAKTALSPRPVVSESEQEQEYALPVHRRTIVRTKTRHQIPRKSSASDFEQSYAANIAPIYLTRPRRPPIAGSGSRIPGPVTSAAESHASSRRTSPDKRFITAKSRGTRPSRPSSPLGNHAATKRAGNRVASQGKDKSSRVPSNMGSKSGILKPHGSGVKVSTITKQFERINRHAERSKTHYNVIRGKRPRPVTSAHARVVILPSVQDAIKDETDISGASSEADDEADANEDDLHKSSHELVTTENAEVPPTDASTTTTEDVAPLVPPVQPETETLVDSNAAKQPPGPPQLPVLDSGKQKHESLTSDLETLPIGTERGSFFRTLSGLLLQQPSTKQKIEIDESTNDPEYIYNDSSMIVRTDEPTSIIALALE